MWFLIRWLGKTGILVAVLMLLGAGSGLSQEGREENTFEVMGIARLGEGAADGRASAVSNSLVRAVSLVVSEILPHETIVRNFHVLNQALYTKTDNFIQDYKVVTKSRSGKQYMVLVKATVLREHVIESLGNLGLLMGERSYPKVLFLISEKTVEDDLPQYWWGEDLVFVPTVAESALSEKMGKDGFIIISHDDLNEPLNLAVKISDQEAVELGKKFEAEIVIVGTSVAGISANTMGEDIKTFTGDIEARAIGVDTMEGVAEAKTHATATSDDPFFGGKEAMADAGIQAGELLSAQIRKAWLQASARSALIELVVEGTGGNIANFVRFRTALNDLPGVNEVKMKEMTPDAAVLSVDFQGSTKALADALILKTFATFGINIFDVNEGQLGIELVDR